MPSYCTLPFDDLLLVDLLYPGPERVSGTVLVIIGVQFRTFHGTAPVVLYGRTTVKVPVVELECSVPSSHFLVQIQKKCYCYQTKLKLNLMVECDPFESTCSLIVSSTKYIVMLSSTYGECHFEIAFPNRMFQCLAVSLALSRVRVFGSHQLAYTIFPLSIHWLIISHRRHD